MARRYSTRETGIAARIAGAGLAVGLALAAIAPVASARRSDPVRNLFPEEPCVSQDTQTPIYYVLPSAAVDDLESPPPEALLQEFLNKHTAMDYRAAAEAAMRLINAVPDRSVGYYNLACAMSRMQRMDEAFDALNQAIEHGWRDETHVRLDPDLAAMRNDPRLQETLRLLRERLEAERITPAPLRSDDWQAIVGDLTRDVPAMLGRAHVPGATIALIDGGRVAWTASFGVRDTRSEQALRAEDRFRLRAPLHLLAIAACQTLQDERKVDIAALIVEAANQSGLGSPPPDARAAGAVPGARPASIHESDRPTIGLGQMPDRRTSNPPPHMRSYSRRSAYGFLRLAVETASGQSFPAYCEASILPGLGLEQCGFAMPKEADELVTGHSYLGTPLRPGVVQGEFAPGGCVYMTAGDLARLIARLMPPLINGDPEQHAIFGDEDAEAARLSGAVELVTKADLALAGALELALQRREVAGGPRMQVDESAAGIVCLARWYPQSGRGIVVLCNSATGRDAAERIAHLALGGE